MLALDRALNQLEKQTGFARDFDRLVVERGGFPCGWMTAEKINEELAARGFWGGSRRAVHPDGRVRLIERFLDQRVEEFLPAAQNGWKRFDGQYKRNPRTRLVDYRGQQMGQSFSRRGHTRVEVDGVTCQYGPVINLAPAGLMFCTVEPPKMKAGDRGYLRIEYGSISLRVRVKVVWVNPDEHGTQVGCDFRGLTFEDQQNLSRIMIGASTGDD
ncbi:MAG: PilZ domain-containing protein [Planctomycetota bacterium]